MRDLIKKIKELPGFFSLTKASENEVAEAENTLGVTFAEDYKEYVLAFGVVSVNGHELTGVCKLKRLNVVEVTIEERAYASDIMKDWYVIEQAHIDGIVIWQDAAGNIYQTAPGTKSYKIYESLIEYIAES